MTESTPFLDIPSRRATPRPLVYAYPYHLTANTIVINESCSRKCATASPHHHQHNNNTPSPNMSALLPGLFFGTALTLSSVASPNLIISQLRLTDFHMLLTFLTASSLSALIIWYTNWMSLTPTRLSTRTPATLLSTPYLGNIVGGSLQGFGMALTGACPGTVLVQIAAGVSSGVYVLVGGVLGGTAFVALNAARNAKAVVTNGVKKDVKAGVDDDDEVPPHTIMSATGLSTGGVLWIYESLLLATISLTDAFAPKGAYPLHPIIGGLLIGVAQISSVAVSKKTVGVSSAYEDVGRWIYATVKGGKGKLGTGNVLFALGVGLGAWVTLKGVPTSREVFGRLGRDAEREVGVLAAVLGGFVQIFGARLAGGCTSGHGISGMSTMSLSSFVTVACMFGAGIATALLLA